VPKISFFFILLFFLGVPLLYFIYEPLEKTTLRLTYEQKKEIDAAYNDCKVGHYSIAHEKFERIAKPFINQKKANIELLNKARKQIELENNVACGYYMQFFNTFDK